MPNYLAKMINDSFPKLVGKDVVIFGTGKIASRLIDSKNELVFRIAGVMDRTMTEGEFKGVRVVNAGNIHNIAKNIIIAASFKNLYIIYNRISFLKDKGICIYFIDGTEMDARYEIRASEYFAKTHEQLILLINEHDIISFDVFDTLVMRRCLYPSEVFSILEERRGETGFAKKRIDAEKAVSIVTEHLPTIFDIYEHMGLTHSDAAEEIELEKELLEARGDVMPYYRYAIEHKKTVILTSDMYIPGEIINEMLEKCGINDYEKLFVSCDIGKTKREGNIWDKVRHEYQNGRLLHIGDNIVSDTIKRNDMTSCLIKGTVEVAFILGLDKAMSVAKTGNDNMIIGTVLARLLTLDYLNVNDDGTINISNATDLGYCFIAPLTLGYTVWLAKTAVANKEEKLYFFARDTYIIMRLYEKIREQYNAPLGEYLYISKRVLCGAFADSLSVIEYCLKIYYDSYNPNSTVSEALFYMFGVSLPDDNFTSGLIKNTDCETVIEQVRNKYFGYFQNNALKEKKNFMQYLKKMNIDLKHSALVDFIAGRSINILRELFGGNVYLFGMVTHLIPVVLHKDKCYMWCNAVQNKLTGSCYFTKCIALLESIHSSPEGTCISFDDNGNPVLDIEEKNNKVYDEIFKGIEMFSDNIKSDINIEMADMIFGILFSGNYSADPIFKEISIKHYIYNNC